jgi:hypothetical protein
MTFRIRVAGWVARRALLDGLSRIGWAACALGCLDPQVKEAFDTGTSAAGGSDNPGPLGAPCVPEDELDPSFSGFSEGEINISSRDPQCAAGTCLGLHFQGRVTCPEGNADGATCLTPDGDPVTASVKPTLPDRPAAEAVYCSCRCGGPLGSGPFCACPSGMVCQLLFDAPALASVAQASISGSYCVKPE